MEKYAKIFEEFTGPSYGGMKSGKRVDMGGRGEQINDIQEYSKRIFELGKQINDIWFYWIDGLLMLVNNDKTEKIEIPDITAEDAEEMLKDIHDSEFFYKDLDMYLQANKYDFEKTII